MAIRLLHHHSILLERNPCGDPAERDLWIYLPPGYDESDARYPVLWCLTGFTGTGGMALSGNRWAPGLADRLDRLIGEGCPPVIVALPDCFTRWGGSQYLNSAALGPYEDYLCEELVPFVEDRFRTSGARGVFGKSSGGYGALRLAMRRPGTFHASACHSGDMGFAFCYLQDFAKCAARFARAGSMEKWVEAFERGEKKKSADFPAINTVAMAAAYSPDPDEPFGIALPFEPETGELIPEVWRRWKANDPVVMVEESACQDALRSLKLLLLDCGSEDEYQLHLGMRLMKRRLEELSIPHVVEEFADDHRSISYRYDRSVPMIARALAGS
jgi:S-formylglutathione hydrolase FrmB